MPHTVRRCLDRHPASSNSVRNRRNGWGRIALQASPTRITTRDPACPADEGHETSAALLTGHSPPAHSSAPASHTRRPPMTIPTQPLQSPDIPSSHRGAAALGSANNAIQVRWVYWEVSVGCDSLTGSRASVCALGLARPVIRLADSPAPSRARPLFPTLLTLRRAALAVSWEPQSPLVLSAMRLLQAVARYQLVIPSGHQLVHTPQSAAQDQTTRR